MKIAITCGGTGGHVFPGLATAAAIAEKGHDVAVVLSGRDIENTRPDDWPGSVIHVPCPAPRWGSMRAASHSILTLTRAFRHAVRELRRFEPDALLAMGSYTSVPSVLAARRLHIPVILHEANVVPGSAVSRLRPFARLICTAFPEAAGHFPSNTPTRNTGMPIRDAISQPPPSFRSDPEPFTVLIMGGSQGAAALNAVVTAAVRLLDADPEEARRMRIIHLAGRQHETAVRNAYADIRSIPVTVVGFCQDMGACYAASDFCLSRAGAASCFELRLRGLPNALVPLPSAARNHQQANADAMRGQGCSEVLPQASLDARSLADYLRQIRRDGARRNAMHQALRATATPDAANRLADAVLACADGSPPPKS